MDNNVFEVPAISKETFTVLPVDGKVDTLFDLTMILLRNQQRLYEKDKDYREKGLKYAVVAGFVGGAFVNIIQHAGAFLTALWGK